MILEVEKCKDSLDLTLVPTRYYLSVTFLWLPTGVSPQKTDSLISQVSLSWRLSQVLQWRDRMSKRWRGWPWSGWWWGWCPQCCGWCTRWGPRPGRWRETRRWRWGCPPPRTRRRVPVCWERSRAGLGIVLLPSVWCHYTYTRPGWCSHWRLSWIWTETISQVNSSSVLPGRTSRHFTLEGPAGLVRHVGHHQVGGGGPWGHRDTRHRVGRHPGRRVWRHYRTYKLKLGWTIPLGRYR